MEWIDAVQGALNYIEGHLLEEVDAEKAAKAVYTSAGALQKAFRILTGLAVGDYIRNRRLSLAAGDLAFGGARVLDTALKYGYDTPESFAKAFAALTAFQGGYFFEKDRRALLDRGFRERLAALAREVGKRYEEAMLAAR